MSPSAWLLDPRIQNWLLRSVSGFPPSLLNGRDLSRTNKDDSSWITDDCSIILGLHIILDILSGCCTYPGGHSPLTPQETMPPCQL
ncbi:hypothetical protein STEG23_022846 [Scotinomys teguina]